MPEKNAPAVESDRCEVCGGLLDEEDLFCCNCGTEVPFDETRAFQGSTNLTHCFTCEGCGASMSYDASSQALRCPFCGNEGLIQQRDHKAVRPNRVVPFAINREQAEQAMRAYLGRGFWRPSDLAETAAITAMVPVYVPYWVFQAKLHTYWTADTSKTPFGARGDWFPLFGEDKSQCEGLLVAASGALSQYETNSLSPFDLSAGVPPEDVDLDRVTVEQFGVVRKHARPLALRELDAFAEQQCRMVVPGNCRNMKVNVRIEGMSSLPVLLPVWIMAYQYEQKSYRFLVNGQTGKVLGQAPKSWKKIATAVVIGIGIAAFAMLLALAFRG